MIIFYTLRLGRKATLVTSKFLIGTKRKAPIRVTGVIAETGPSLLSPHVQPNG